MPMLHRQVPLPVASVFAALIVCCGLAGAQPGSSVFAASGPWVDHRGQPFATESLRASATIVSMAYGACRRVCSSSLRVLEQIQARADARAFALNFVVIGLDPAQDRPADWAAYRAQRKLNRGNWHFLSGDAAATASIAQRLGVRYWRYGEHTMHDFRILRLSAEGRIVAEMTTHDQDLAALLP
jgi:cytochrome oxidase Cu insertion factor (SCO1/SenC/PrrC family)